MSEGEGGMGRGTEGKVEEGMKEGRDGGKD